MCLSAIRNLEVPSRCRVAIYRTIVLKCHFDRQCIPIPMTSMPAAIFIPSTLLKHSVKCISPQRSSVQLALLQSTRDQQGVHSPLVSEHEVSLSAGANLTTFLLFRAVHFESSGVPHPVELVYLQSAFHALNTSLQNIVPWRRAFPSHYHPVDLQVHLKTATSSENTSYRVNGILVLQ